MKFIIGLFIPFVLCFITRSQLAILQAEHYELKRYFKYNAKKNFFVVCAMGILLIIGLFSNELIFLFSFIASLGMDYTLINNHRLHVTNRVKRIWCIYFVELYLIYCIIPFDSVESVFVLNNLFMFMFLIVNLTSIGVETIILNIYKKEAQKIIDNKFIIGITGSYGKTSCKNIIYDMLENLCNISKTPKSYNTKVGIIKSIRENVSEYDDIFVCEYGVDRKNGMNKLLDVVKPNISLITEIGPQHLLTFKNIENIVNEKIKLASVLGENEFAVINTDNKYLREKINDLKCNVITYGIDGDSYIKAKNIIMNKDGSCFDLYVNNKKIKKIKIKLLGKHNVLNVLGAIGVLLALKINLNHVDSLALNIKQVEHRLQLKLIDGYKVIDDSFNSNELGFRMAISVLNLMKEEKIVITPGVIEQGKNSDKVNFALGQYMADKISSIILVDKNYEVIKDGLLSKGFNEGNIILKNNFFDAWEYVKKNIDKNNKIILIENDLPSIYLR